MKSRASDSHKDYSPVWVLRSRTRIEAQGGLSGHVFISKQDADEWMLQPFAKTLYRLRKMLGKWQPCRVCGSSWHWTLKTASDGTKPKRRKKP